MPKRNKRGTLKSKYKLRKVIPSYWNPCNIAQGYQVFCEKRGISFQKDNSVKSYDGSTLFCPAGMQQFKDKFKNKKYKGTIANIQDCLRMDDFDKVGDGTHLIYFRMVGLFSFRELTIKEAIDFWMKFLDTWSLPPDTVTIHPDKKEWKKYYKEYKCKVVEDKECKWSDGEIGGYCTEFFYQGHEIGNIVNPMGDCIDAGFGLERMEHLINYGETDNFNRTKNLSRAAEKITKAGYKPSNLKQGYVLRKILRELVKAKSHRYLHKIMPYRYWEEEIVRQEKIKKRYNKLKGKFPNKSKKWWYETHGVEL